jgi:E3 ubiquitin-protein ligase HECTD1
MHPHMTIVRKSSTDNPDNMFPSVNTCAHYLKLPEYTNEEVMRRQLLIAITSRGFHLN